VTWEGRITFEVSSADPDSDSPVWVDFSQRVLDVVQTVDIYSGRQNDLQGGEPGTFTLILNNSDDALTYGNTSSPYAAWWAPGRKCRVREAIGLSIMDLATGYLQTPSETLITAGIEHRISMSVVDRIARLGGAEPFISTLGAHIKGSVRGNCLFGYWSLTDASGPFADSAGTTPAVATSLTSTVSNVEQWPSAEYQSGDPIPGDDARPVLLVPGLNAGAVAWNESAIVAFDLSTSNFPVLSAGQVLTAVIWTSRRPDFPVISGFGPLTLTHNDGVVDIQRTVDPAGDYFRITSPLGTLTGNVSAAAGSAAATDRYYIIGMRFGFTPNTLELWVDDAVYTATLSGVLAGPLNISGMSGFAYGSIAHMQLYVGAANDFTHDDFLAQRQVGLAGLERQTTGERIRTIASYAGVRGGEMVVDTGTSVMTRATLAGLTPAQAMRDAERTEQGLLYVDGSGRIVFKDRRSLYNI
jgi:hypothetical protein